MQKETSFAIVIFLGLLVACTTATEFLCFKNEGAPGDFHYYRLNMTDAHGNQYFQGFDYVVGQGPQQLTGSFSKLGSYYEFHTNQPLPPPATVYINTWPVAQNGTWLPGYLYGFATNFLNTQDPLTFAPQYSSFKACQSRNITGELEQLFFKWFGY